MPRAAALIALQQIIDAGERHSMVQSAMAAIHQDFQWLSPIPTAVETAVVALIDAVLGENLASYFLYDCRRNGRVILPDQTEHLIRSVADIAHYLDETRPG